MNKNLFKKDVEHLFEKLYIKKYLNNVVLVNNNVCLPDSKYLPIDFSFDKYTILEKIYYDNNYFDSDFYIESNYDTCYLCNKNINCYKVEEKYNVFKNNINLNEMLFEKIKNKTFYKNKIFSYSKTIMNSFNIYYYYHLCDSCYNTGIYFWSLCYKNKYPSTSIEGYCFIHKYNNFVPEIISKKSYNVINKLNISSIFICNK